jgi:nucleoside-diphosphate-sugar epimerase
VHISSIAIYGLDPPLDSVTEAGNPKPGRNDYGVVKLRQDEMVLRLHQSGIPSYILVPGNITGPYSPFIRNMAERLMRGPIHLVDEGRYASNLIHVDNLVEAILTVVRSTSGAGERYFVNELQEISWRRVFDDLSDRLGFTASYLNTTRDKVLPYVMGQSYGNAGLAAHARILLSGEFRRALSLLPAFKWANETTTDFFSRLPAATRSRMKERLRWPIRIPKDSSGPSLDDRYVKVQVRRFYHSPAKLKGLGWQPPLDYEHGMATIAAWLRFAGVCR